MSHNKPEPNEWVSPVMTNYKLQCCDCGLVHEMDFQIVKYIGEKDENGFQECEVIEDKDIQVHFRARRLDITSASASELLLLSATPFDLACMKVREMEKKPKP